MKIRANVLQQMMICFTLSLLLAACQAPERIEEGIILKNFNIITLEDEKVLKDHVVIISADSIRDILPQEELDDYYEIPDSLTLDGKGNYLMPSFHDMHVHLQPNNPHHKKYLRHFLGYGITDLRVMSGSERLLSWKDSIQSGTLLGPELKIAGPLIDGEKPLWGTSHKGPVVSDITKVDSIVADHKARGYDLIKLYERLPKQVYLEFLKAAEQRKIRVAGHVPYSLLFEPEIQDLFNERAPSFEHFSNFGPLVTKQEILKKEQPDDFLYYGYELASDPDPAKIRQVVEEIKHSNTWICPTSVLWRNSADSLRIAGIIEGDAFKRIDEGLRNWWLSTKGSTQRNRELADLSEELLREMARQKAKVLVGTDFPNPFLVPGYSVHQEIHTLVEMGYSNVEALKAATIYPAQYWGKTEKEGLLSPGRTANLIILKENPLERIENTLTLEQVIYKGRPLSSQRLLEEELGGNQNSGEKRGGRVLLRSRTFSEGIMFISGTSFRRLL